MLTDKEKKAICDEAPFVKCNNAAGCISCEYYYYEEEGEEDE